MHCKPSQWTLAAACLALCAGCSTAPLPAPQAQALPCPRPSPLLLAPLPPPATPAGYADAPVSYAIADASPAAMAPAAERDVATWIADALESYETCRARIDALRAWDQTAFGATKQGAIDGR